MPRYIRVYRCPDCGHKWKTESALGFLEPDCPQCGFHPDPIPDRVCAPAIIGTKAKAVDVAQKIVEEDYGLTNMRDNAREGETAIIMPSMPTSAAIPPGNVVQQGGGFMWGGAGGNFGGKPNQAMIDVAKTRQAAAATAKLNDAQGVNPMRKLHQAKPVLQQNSVGRANPRVRSSF